MTEQGERQAKQCFAVSRTPGRSQAVVASAGRMPKLSNERSAAPLKNPHWAVGFAQSAKLLSSNSSGCNSPFNIHRRFETAKRLIQLNIHTGLC